MAAARTSRRLSTILFVVVCSYNRLEQICPPKGRSASLAIEINPVYINSPRVGERGIGNLVIFIIVPFLLSHWGIFSLFVRLVLYYFVNFLLNLLLRFVPLLDVAISGLPCFRMVIFFFSLKII